MAIDGPALPEPPPELATREARAAAWDEMGGRLPGLLEQLEGSEVYGRPETGRPKAPRTHGVYLFTEGGVHMYVGRTGLTERSVKGGKQSASGFRARLAGHSRPASDVNSASFALRMAMKAAAGRGIDVPAKRADRLKNDEFAGLFTNAKKQITAMDFRTVEIEDDRESAVFEIYAAFVLNTQYNSFATS